MPPKDYDNVVGAVDVDFGTGGHAHSRATLWVRLCILAYRGRRQFGLLQSIKPQVTNRLDIPACLVYYTRASSVKFQ